MKKSKHTIIPYTETFESTSSIRNCWTTSGNGSWTIGTGDYTTSTGAYEGNYNALITHSSTGVATKLISPALNGVNNGLTLSFAYVMRSWYNDTDEMRIYSRTNASSAWQQVAEYTEATSSWTLETVYILGTVYQIAFEFIDHYGYGLGIDNVSFSPISTDFCYPVTNLTASNITAHEATLTWTGNADNYTIYNMADASNVLIYAHNSTITVLGAEEHDVFVYDMNGRCIYQRADANETENISMSSAGIYMVRIDNAIFKKVVIVK